jgi:hypothetical protein
MCAIMANERSAEAEMELNDIYNSCFERKLPWDRPPQWRRELYPDRLNRIPVWFRFGGQQGERLGFCVYDIVCGKNCSQCLD